VHVAIVQCTHCTLEGERCAIKSLQAECIVTSNVPLILKVQEICFFSRAKHMFKKIISWTFKIRGTLVCLYPKEREREKEREGESKSKREGA
jgi:hypothetical protein